MAPFSHDLSRLQELLALTGRELRAWNGLTWRSFSQSSHMLPRNVNNGPLAELGRPDVKLWQQNHITRISCHILQTAWRLQYIHQLLGQKLPANELQAVACLQIFFCGYFRLENATDMSRQGCQPGAKVGHTLNVLYVEAWEVGLDSHAEIIGILQNSGSAEASGNIAEGCILPIVRVAYPALRKDRRVHLSQGHLHAKKFQEQIVL